MKKGATDAENGDLYGKSVYLWKYRNYHIGVTGDGFKDQWNVYHFARAIEILRCRYPKAYQKLFVEVQSYPVGPPTLKKFLYTEKYQTLFFNFDTNPLAIAAGEGVFGDRESTGGTPWLSLVSFHVINMQGETATGSKPLYNKSAPENYARYMREGLVETLTHEMLHRYVNVRKGYDEYAEKLQSMRDSGSESNGLWEEALVANTSLLYFLQEGGLQPSMPFFYRSTIEANFTVLNALRTTRLPQPIDLEGPLQGINWSLWRKTDGTLAFRLPWLD